MVEKIKTGIIAGILIWLGLYIFSKLLSTI